jgi:2-polyprenyl-3-methyl-5-hydroxy-6-metoxy-1,4-benzoquinol methylase
MLIPMIVRKIESGRPNSILDIGIGFGKYGFLAREYTDICYQRYAKDKWTTRIDGIEIFPNYVSDIQRSIYSNIYIGNVLDVLPTLGDYDMVMFFDVIEHLKYEDGIRILDMIKRKCKVGLISTPVKVMPQRAENGNEHELHISQFPREVLERYGTVSEIKDGNGIYLLEIRNV